MRVDDRHEDAAGLHRFLERLIRDRSRVTTIRDMIKVTFEHLLADFKQVKPIEERLQAGGPEGVNHPQSPVLGGAKFLAMRHKDVVPLCGACAEHVCRARAEHVQSTRAEHVCRVVCRASAVVLVWCG